MITNVICSRSHLILNRITNDTLEINKQTVFGCLNLETSLQQAQTLWGIYDNGLTNPFSLENTFAIKKKTSADFYGHSSSSQHVGGSIRLGPDVVATLENIRDFLKNCMYFNVSFPVSRMSSNLSQKQTCCTMIFK